MTLSKKHIILLLMVLGWGACDNSIDLQINQEENIYSIYGTLEIGAAQNYIRVHDTNQPLTEKDTEELNVDLFLKDVTLNVTDLMIDRVIQFDGVYTHNYYSSLPIEYDREYIVRLEDEDGFQDSLSAFTPRETKVEIIDRITRNDPSDASTNCDRKPVIINISPVDFGREEYIDYEVGFRYNGRNFYVRNRPVSTTRADSTFSLTFFPNQVINEIFGSDSGVECMEDNVGTFFFNFRHYGRPGFGHQGSFENGELVSVASKRVLGFYEVGDIEILVDTTDVRVQ